ncbi:unnamed protein product, partial [Rotaria sp. Silwood2]
KLLKISSQKKCKHFKPPFDIHIRDKQDDFVTLDDDYLEDYNPFTPTTIDITSVQPSNTSTTTVLLQVILLSYASNFINDEESMQTEEIVEINNQQNYHIQQIDQSVSISKSQTC